MRLFGGISVSLQPCLSPGVSSVGGRAATRITIAASVGITAASMCINQRLYGIARVHAVMITRSEVSSHALSIDKSTHGVHRNDALS